MSQTLYLSDERAIGVDEIHDLSFGQGVTATNYFVFDLDRVQDVMRGPWRDEYATKAEALAAAREYIEATGLEVNR